DVVAQLARGEAVSGKAVDQSEGVAEVVVEARPDHATRQGMTDVADVLAHLVPNVGYLGGAGRALEVDEDGRAARRRVAAQEVEAAGFLQLALEALGDLLQRVVEGRAGPRRLHHHGAEGERRVLVAAKAEIGGKACDRDYDHQKDGEG